MLLFPNKPTLVEPLALIRAESFKLREAVLVPSLPEIVKVSPLCSAAASIFLELAVA